MKLQVLGLISVVLISTIAGAKEEAAMSYNEEIRILRASSIEEGKAAALRDSMGEEIADTELNRQNSNSYADFNSGRIEKCQQAMREMRKASTQLGYNLEKFKNSNEATQESASELLKVKQEDERTLYNAILICE